MDRASRRRCETDLGPVRARRQQRRHDHRDRGHQRGAHAGRRQRLDARACARERPLPRDPERQHEPGQHIKRQQRHLIAPDRHQPAEHPGRHAGAPRGSLERARDEPQRERQIGQADHLAGVLQPRIGGTAERERHRRHQRAAHVPAAVAKEQDDAEPAEKQIGEGDGVEGAQADGGIERRQHDMERREQQRLRIGNLRPAGEDVRRPPWPFAARDRRRQELHLRIELRFRVPRDGYRAGQPWPGRHQEGEREDRQRDSERNARGRGRP